MMEGNWKNRFLAVESFISLLILTPDQYPAQPAARLRKLAHAHTAPHTFATKKTKTLKMMIPLLHATERGGQVARTIRNRVCRGSNRERLPVGWRYLPA